MYKNYYCEIMRPPELRGPGASVPPAPWLIRHWVSYEHTSSSEISFPACCFQHVV